MSPDSRSLILVIIGAAIGPIIALVTKRAWLPEAPDWPFLFAGAFFGVLATGLIGAAWKRSADSPHT